MQSKKCRNVWNDWRIFCSSYLSLFLVLFFIVFGYVMYYNAFETKENEMKTNDTIELQRIIALLQAVAKIPTRQFY